MVKPIIISEKSINMPQLKEELANIKKRDNELNFRAATTEDYLNRFVTIDRKKADELFKKLESLEIPRIKRRHLNKLIDVMPKTAEDVKVVLQGYPITVNNKNVEQIAKTISDFA